MEPILQIEDLTHTYSAGTPFQRSAVEGLSMTVGAGEFLGVIGHTGSGKSTLIQHLNGLLQPTSGRILLEGKDIWADPKKIRDVRFKVGLVFQYPEYQLFEETIAKDIAFGPKNQGLSEEEIDQRVRRAMESGGNAWLKGEEAPCRPVVDDASVFKANIWSARSREELAELRERVAAEVPELSLVFPNNRVRLFDILPAGWDKGCAALELARALDLTSDEVAVFGDSDNDLPMIGAVPNSVAVANANEAVTAAARWHIGAAADDAVAGALHQIAACAATGEMPSFMRQADAAGSGIADV